MDTTILAILESSWESLDSQKKTLQNASKDTEAVSDAETRSARDAQSSYIEEPASIPALQVTLLTGRPETNTWAEFAKKLDICSDSPVVSSEHREFLKHLALLRGEGNTFLSMLNDTRRQVRELYYSGNNGDGAVGIQAYRPVLRDLARILVLVNRRDEEIPIPPDDWQRLFSWAERLLRRYKRHSSPEVAQLVTFLQEPPAAPSTESNAAQQVKISQSPRPYQLRTAATNLTTFQANIPLTTFQASDKSSISPASSSLGYLKDSPPSSSLGQNSSKFSPNGSSIGQRTPLVFDNQKQTKSSKAHLQELSVPTFNCSFSTGASTEEHTCGMGHCESNGLDPELNPQWEFHGSMEAANYTILSDWSPTREYLIDDFTILGFRPQDEITTEL
ncbi:FU domain-containing protein T48 isoform X6 [Lasioglossum baleicum]|uniref:FU domain-containing protein T48 isoform X6 n=1 Tax=Lasioglossum baleicum TaxID=434251 RepID=UPI003FCC8F3E